MRTIVDLQPEQLEHLGKYCAREGVSRAEAIRRAVDKLVEEPAEDKEAARIAALRSAFGAWKDHGETTDEYLARIRPEWGFLNDPAP
ncbi:MAG: ribbon-helix-helix protein, CopG family [Dehalococcoidia bacterium]